MILTPLWVNLWGQQPFELPKVMLMRTLVWALAGLAIAEVSLSRHSLWSEVRANPVAGSVGLLALIRQRPLLGYGAGSVPTWLRRAETACRSKGAADYQEAVRLLPASGHAYAGLATCYWALGRSGEASLAVGNEGQRR